MIAFVIWVVGLVLFLTITIVCARSAKAAGEGASKKSYIACIVLTILLSVTLIVPSLIHTTEERRVVYIDEQKATLLDESNGDARKVSLTTVLHDRSIVEGSTVIVVKNLFGTVVYIDCVTDEEP